MRKIFSFFFLMIIVKIHAQILEPVKWSFSVNQKDDEAELLMTATIDEGWHLYSIDIPETSPVFATDFVFEEDNTYQIIDSITEPEPLEEFDPNFEEILKYHEKKVIFKQKIKVFSEEDFTIKAELVFMTCNDQMCLPPEYRDIKFELKKAQQSKTDSSPTSSSRSLWSIFILSFLGGLAALFTPCVFPMIPLTVSFFTKQSKDRSKGLANAMIYGISIIILYVVLGYLITLLFGPDALNALSTNPWVNIVFFILLVIFAISFFGAFEITLPSSWTNRADRASDREGIVGIFFMAFTLALISFSCTGPIIGALLFEAFSGGVRGPLIGMFGFSSALALPFTLFAAFPGWLNSLPKTGGWLNSVKVTLGFIELAFAFKFLSTADLVWQAGILKREWFIGSWIAIFALMTLYLLGKFRMPHDSPLEKLSVPRLMIATLSLMFTIYLIPGLWGAPLKLISGFPPPMFYSESPNGFGIPIVIASKDDNDIPKGVDPTHCPHGLNCFHDFEKGLAYAKEINKPIMLDFTGWGCVNCRKMEEQVWSDSRVLEILKNDVVLISLYVDERQQLPKEKQYISRITGKKVKTIGNKWSEFQVKYFKNNSQPQYIVLGHNSMKPLIEPIAYDPNISKFVDWLQRGIEKFENS